ncbi:MAG: hypothetical protein WD795_13655 [Woeseia sp.]
MSAVADTHRPGLAVAFEVVEFALRQMRLSEYVVDHVEPRPAEPRRMKQPVDEELRLLPVAQIDERLHDKRRVPKPAVAVVPVTRAADVLGQGCRRCGDDRSRQAVAQ